ncbi:MAG: type IV secretory system conjugative DNA transfer family protein [Nostocaceae cyanobacterium]|nr:type IV secretory system conjugative DNA transfer family protein [Nostocaceae cyanobacterium]
MKQQTESNPTNQLTQSLTDSGLTGILFSPMGLLLLVCVGGLIWAFSSNGKGTGKGNKNKLARARWAGRREKIVARKIACAQMEGRKHNRVSLFVSSTKVKKPDSVNGKIIMRIPESESRLYFPDVQRGVLVCGVTGSGKTFSMINPLLRSAIDQGFPVVLYDLKYSQLKSPTSGALGQTAKLAGYAAERGYKVSVLSPGFGESAIANPLDFLESEIDSAMARQLAIALNKNLKLSSGDSDSSGFFSNAGDLLSQGIFMLAKGTCYPDILMCFAILSLPNLIKRIENAEMNLWTRASFSQFLSVAGSPETAASIVGTALGLFTRFIIPELLSAFCGQTNLPLDLKERQMVIFGMDDEKRDVVSPLVASVLHLLVTRNVAKQRSTPLILSLDELPTIYLPSLAGWLNQKRENGLVSILGLQNLSQLEESYGQQTAETIFTGCVTKAFFNAGSGAAAEKYSKYLGEEEIRNKQRSRTTGGKGGASTNTSNESDTRPLFEVSQFNTLSEGRAVIISPGYKSGQDIALPLLEKIKLSSLVESELEASSVSLWYDYQQALTKQSQIQQIVEQDLLLRKEEAERLFPLQTPEQVKVVDKTMSEI